MFSQWQGQPSLVQEHPMELVQLVYSVEGRIWSNDNISMRAWLGSFYVQHFKNLPLLDHRKVPRCRGGFGGLFRVWGLLGELWHIASCAQLHSSASEPALSSKVSLRALLCSGNPLT
eukprot:2837981-Amphidinium_carterae.1